MAKTRLSEKKKKSSKNKLEIVQNLAALIDETNEKEAKKIPRDGVGRPTIMTVQTLNKLEQAFKIGCPDREACIYAGISLQTLYNYGKRNPLFLEQKEDWKENPVLAARANVVNSITTHKSVTDSWEYLRRKRKEEFSEMKHLSVGNAMTVKDLDDMARGDIVVIPDEDEDLTEEDDE